MEKIISRVLILVVMEDGLVLRELLLWISAILVLILVVMEDGLVLSATEQPMPGDPMVLILVVMEDGLVQVLRQVNQMTSKCLNPCCNGRWSRTRHSSGCIRCCRSLNPCCNGRWSRTSN